MIEERWAEVEAAVQDLPLPEQKAVLSKLSDYIRQQARSSETREQKIARQKKAWEEVFTRLEKMPIEGPDDGFSGRDHDKILHVDGA